MEGSTMFSGHGVAARSMEAMKRVIAELEQMLIDLEPVAPADEYCACRRAVGHVMVEVFDRLAEPITANHPDLRYRA
jgi:hypothetical protein